MNTLRKAGDNREKIITAALLLDKHLKEGYPDSIYCPYTYDEVQIDFGTPPPNRIIIPDTIKKQQ